MLLAKLVIIGSKAFKFNSFTIRNLEDLGMLAVSQLNIRRNVVVETKTKLNPEFYFHYDQHVSVGNSTIYLGCYLSLATL